MPLSPGQRLGPYEIVAPLGAGGITGMSSVTMTPDATTFAFNYRQRISELFLVEGLE